MNTIRLGSKGEDVKFLQKNLNLVQDGIFGTLTEEAVKTFQAQNGLIADGIVGPGTWAKLSKPQGRIINEIILHCSATQEGKDYTTEDIKKWHLQRGFSDIGYHYVIYRDGSVHKGREEEIIGANCTGHNSHSIGICYIGGCDSKMNAKDTRTPEQKKALTALVHDLMTRYNLNAFQVHCHNEFADKACPSFKIETFRKEL